MKQLTVDIHRSILIVFENQARYEIKLALYIQGVPNSILYVNIERFRKENVKMYYLYICKRVFFTPFASIASDFFL